MNLKLKYHANSVEENARIQAWHATFNAYVQGVCANSTHIYHDRLSQDAALFADTVHGNIPRI